MRPFPLTWLFLALASTSGPLRAAAGLPVISLPGSTLHAAGPPDSAVTASFGDGGKYRRKPATFARAVQVSWDFDLTANGTWAEAVDGGRTWQLCLRAPGAHSLSILFRALRLPLQSELLVWSAQAAGQGLATGDCLIGCQRLTLHDSRGRGPVLTAPTHGDTAVVQYHEPRGRQRGPALSLHVGAVLLGEVPLPAQLPTLSQPAGEAATKAATANSSTIGTYLSAARDLARGKAKACQPELDCESEWGAEADAVVLLIGIDGSSGFYCTATLINAPANQQYLITANHCLGQTSNTDTEVFWGVFFDYQTQCGSNTSAASVPQYKLLQGLDVVWTNEVTDVMLLRLDDEIPEAYNIYWLGWDASTWVQPPDGSVCIHHPVGDTKKIALTKQDLVDGQYLVDDPTHYLATWDIGAMESGSSGAMLIDATTRLGLGPLTGGNENEACQGGEDIFGSLHVAWQLGLWQYLGTGGKDGNATMGPRQPTRDGPGLIVDPDLLVVEEGAGAIELEIRLSDAPDPGELIIVNVSTTGGSPVSASPAELVFNESNWEQAQTVLVFPGDDKVQDGGMSFFILLQLTSDQRASFYKRRSIPGMRLDDETPAGSTPRRPITASAEPDQPFRTTGSLSAGAASPSVVLGQTTLADFEAAVTPGAAVYFAFFTARIAGMSMVACSSGAPMRLIMFSPEGVALWSSAEDCSLGASDPCQSFEGGNMCSGFQSFYLLGTDGAGPYIIAVISSNHGAASFSFSLELLSPA